MAKQKKSKFYDDFKVAKIEDNSPKKTWIKVWKWIKIVFVIIFITIGLVGCMQTFAVKASNKVGAGQELYTKKADVSPNVETLRYNPKTNFFERANDEKNTNANTFLGLSTKDKKLDGHSIIEKLKRQDANSGATYGNYNGKTLALQLQKQNSKGNFENITSETDDNNGLVYGNGKTFAYYNLGNEKGEYGTKTYTPVTKFEQVLMPLPSFHSKDAKTLFDKIKEIRLTELLANLPGGSREIDKYVRDIFQILVNETIKYWYENNVGKTKDNGGFKDYFDQYVSSMAGTTKLEKLNNYFKTFTKSKITEKIDDPAKATEDEGKAFANLSKISLAFVHYATLLKYNSNNPSIQDGGYQHYILKQSFITRSGNYNKSAVLDGLFDSNSSIRQKSITTYKEHWEQGPFYGMFVHPVNHFMHAIINGLGTTGWSIILALVVTVIIVRLLSFAISFKSLFSQAKMEEFNQKKAKIEAKYAEYKNDKQMQQRKQMEITELYKKEKVSPFSGIITSFITMPILIVVFRIIAASPAIKQATWYGIQFSATSFRKVIAGEMLYLPILIVSVGIQALAQYLPKILNRKKKSLRADAYQREAMKKENKKFNIISLIFIGIGAIFSAGLQIYWIIGGIMTILQHIFVHYFQRTKFFKVKVEPKL
ncbi:membrane protein insertase YidC [Metamycoplasma buccale]|uniref:membrane protein insertase YidC n=1 Tax=Metamycoplasma buccale TaxID=55602 RepID=UPI00398ECF44